MALRSDSYTRCTQDQGYSSFIAYLNALQTVHKNSHNFRSSIGTRSSLYNIRTQNETNNLNWVIVVIYMFW